jgi:hypothetical protein
MGRWSDQARELATRVGTTAPVSRATTEEQSEQTNKRARLRPPRASSGNVRPGDRAPAIVPPTAEEVRRLVGELRLIVEGLDWIELMDLGQRIGPGEDRWRKFCDFPPPWLPAALEVAKEQRRLAAELPF